MKEIATPSTTKYILEKYHLNALKKYGQNFLIDVNIINKIVTSAKIDQTTAVIEVGPGIGALTQVLGRYSGKVTSFEIDERFMPVYQEFLNQDNIEIIFGDFMEQDIKPIVDQLKQRYQKVCLVANLPYYITSPVIMKLLEEQLPVESLTVMVQKEAAVRICAAPGTRACGAVSVAVQYYSQPQILFDVPRDCFFPAPNVDSAVIRLNIRTEPPVKLETEEKQFFKLVKAAFGQRRKTVLNSLSTGLGKSKEELSAALQQAGIVPTARAEQLTMEQFGTLCNLLFPNKAQ